MSAACLLQTYSLECFEVSVHRADTGKLEIRLQQAEGEPLRVSADQVTELREVLQQAELYARYQQQLSRQWCPNCGETSDL
jgi:hypothetical protein